jgi:membrane protease YdiL (CAAX protease family)
VSEAARRPVTAVVLVIGAIVLSIDLRLPRGSTAFLVVGVVLALVWSTPTLLFGPSGGRGRTGPRGDLALGAAGGAAMYVVFVAGQAIAREISWLDGPIRSILDKADAGPSVLIAAVALLNGVAEELFFRGSLVDALGEHRAAAHVISFVTYVAVTALVGNTALTVAAIVMGAVLAGERWVTGALYAPIATHVVWSALIIVALPRR